MSKPTKKILGGKKPSKTRKNRKPLKKNKRKNIKKGGFNLFEKPNERFTKQSIGKFFDSLGLYENMHYFIKKDGEPDGNIEQAGVSFSLITKTRILGKFVNGDELDNERDYHIRDRIIDLFNKIYKKIEEIEHDENIPKERIIIQTPKKNCNWKDGLFCIKSITKKTLINAKKKLESL